MDHRDEAAHVRPHAAGVLDRWAAEMMTLGPAAKESFVSISLVWKYVQRIIIISGFSVKWPAALLGFFQSVQTLSPTIDNHIGVGCLEDQQSIELVMLYRWLKPAMLCASCLMAAPVSYLVGWLLAKLPSSRAHNLSMSLLFGPGPALILFFELYSLCAAPFVSASIALLVCQEGPGGILTVVEFRQLECDGPRFRALLPGAIAAASAWATHRYHVVPLMFSIGLPALTGTRRPEDREASL